MNFNWSSGALSRDYDRGEVTIFEFQRGLLYRNGALEKVLGAGRYHIRFWENVKITVIDVRRQSAQITNQKLMTSDQVTVTLNLVADYDYADLALAQHSVANVQSQLYEDVQLAARNIVGGVDVNTLLEKRVEINTQIQEAVVAQALRYGVNVLSVGIKDVILAPRIRDLLLKEVEAKRVATAMLIGAREEVAALRALANAAQLVEKTPALLRLRELDVARSFAANSGNTIMMGVGEKVTPIKAVQTGDTSNEVAELNEE